MGRERLRVRRYVKGVTLSGRFPSRQMSGNIPRYSGDLHNSEDGYFSHFS
jgi:hypothetical protein